MNVQALADGWSHGKTAVLVQSGLVITAFIADALIS